MAKWPYILISLPPFLVTFNQQLLVHACSSDHFTSSHKDNLWIFFSLNHESKLWSLHVCVNESLAVVWQWKEGSYFKAGPFEIITRKNKTVWLPWLSGLCVVSNGPSPLGQLSPQHKYNTNIDNKQWKYKTPDSCYYPTTWATRLTLRRRGNLKEQ